MSASDFAGSDGFYRPRLGRPPRKRARAAGAAVQSRSNSRNSGMRFQNTELQDNAEAIRNPLDPRAYDDSEEFVDGFVNGQSFPSIFSPDNTSDGLAGEELQHAWSRLKDMIATAIDSKTLPVDVVNMVSEFYTTQVQEQFADAPNWPKSLIYKFVYSDDARQAAENIQAVQSTIEFLRNNIGIKKSGNKVDVNSEAVKLLLQATKTHSNLVEAKRRREAR